MRVIPVLCGVGFLLSFPARAASVNVQLFRSPFNLNYGMVESAIPDNAPWSEKSWQPKIFAAADYHYVNDPLVTINTTTNTRVNTLVDSVHTLDLGLGYFFRPDLSVFAQLPLNYSSMPGAAGSAFGLSDARVAGKFSLRESSEKLQFALMPELVLPTGSSSRYLSDDSLGAGLLLIAENDFGAFRLSGNLGYRHAGSAQVSGIDYRKRVPLGLGAAIPIARRWLLNLEGNGAIALPTSQRQNASEFYGGLSYSPVKYTTWIAGAALGAFDKAGSSDVRLQFALRMYLGEERPRPEPARQEAPVPPSPPPPPAPKARLVEDRIETLEEIQFDHNKDTLKAHSKKVLDEIAEIIREHAASIRHIRVEGHTSLPGTDAYNLKLSWRRARAVVAYLVHEQKIPARLLVAKGFGESRPKFREGKATAAQLELNRRVEFNIVRK